VQTVSLQRQLLVRLSLVFAVAILVSTGVFLSEAWQSHQTRRDFTAFRLALALAQTIDRNGELGHDGGPSAKARALAADIENSVANYAVLDPATGRLLQGSSEAYGRQVAGALKHAVGLSTDGLRKIYADGLTDYVVLTDTADGPIAVALRPLADDWQARLAWLRHEVGGELLPILVPLLLATLLTVYLTIRRSFFLIARLSDQAQRLTPQNTAVRLTADPMPSEVAPLISAINGALARIADGFRQQRRFTANVAHQLRNPLAILGARIEELPPSDVRMRMRADLDRMGRLVDQLLAISRLEMRQVEAVEPLDLVKLVRAALADLAPLAIGSGKAIGLIAPERPVRIKGNAAALTEAIRNLVENALRYSCPGDEVEVEMEACGRVAVRDRGPGVPTAVRHRIFEPFWRGDDARSHGAGLGLAIVAETAALHNGRAWVEARPGGGACFLLEIPVET